jgi:hypothetical protein
MSALLCGHERGAVNHVLSVSVHGLALAGLEDVPEDALRAAHHACHDPTKLTEMIASEARRCGVDAGPCCDHGGNHWQFWARGEGIIVDGPEAHLTMQARSMPQARIILSALLQLPNGAREQAERVLRGET